MTWIRSTHCDTNACVEANHQGDEVWVRDSKDPDGPVLKFTIDEWHAFLAGVLEGEFLFA